MAGQNSGFNPDPARINSGTIGNMVGEEPIIYAAPLNMPMFRGADVPP